MKISRDNLLAIVERFQGTKILVLGDLILDHYIWGKVERISPEAPVVVVQVTEESKRPGGSGNVVLNLIELGAQVSVCGVVGDDANGRELVGMLSDRGVEVSGVLVDRSRPTTVKTRVIAHAQQVVRVDREDGSKLQDALSQAIAAGIEARFPAIQGIIVSDYAKGLIGEVLFSKISQGYVAGTLGMGKVPVVVDPKDPNFLLYSRATVVKPNRKEAESASGMLIRNRSEAIKAGKVLLKLWNTEMVLITLGEHGMVLVSKPGVAEAECEIETEAREVYDVSGAGDTVSAVFTLGLSVGASPREAAMLANFAAGVVVAEIGTVPITTAGLIDAINEGIPV